jgi:hypothetical protein
MLPFGRIDTLAHKSEGTNATLQERFSRCGAILKSTDEFATSELGPV